MAKKRKGQTFLLLVELWLIGLNTSLKKVKGSDLQGKNDMDWVMCLERKHPELFDGNENYSKTPPEKVKKNDAAAWSIFPIFIPAISPAV